MIRWQLPSLEVGILVEALPCAWFNVDTTSILDQEIQMVSPSNYKNIFLVSSLRTLDMTFNLILTRDFLIEVSALT